jgi:hypothetical protein
MVKEYIWQKKFSFEKKAKPKKEEVKKNFSGWKISQPEKRKFWGRDREKSG